MSLIVNLPNCVWPGCHRVAVIADWCQQHTPRSKQPRPDRPRPAAPAGPNLFDLPPDPQPSGLDHKLAGQTLAVAPAELNRWKIAFKSELARLAAAGGAFTSEDVIAVVGLPAGDIARDANNAVGAMMTAACKAGVIRKTGNRVQARRPSSHGAELTEWIGAAA